MFSFTTALALALPLVNAVPAAKEQSSHLLDKRISFSNHFPNIGVNATYDFIVIGGGTAGLAVAHRLAESGKHTVAVVEAGGFYEIENGNVSVVPGYNYAYDMATVASANSEPLTDWGFLTTPQPQLLNRTIHYARGKTLGGSSALNAMIYNRGTIGSFDLWAKWVNDPSWTFDNILPYFIKGTNYTLANATLRAANASVPTPANYTFNATGGPMHVSYNNFALPFSSWLPLGFPQIGIASIRDFMSGHLIGSQYAPLTLDPAGEKRSSSEEAYLQASFDSGRTNLKVYTHTLAKRIVFSQNETANCSRRATAVEIVSSSYGNTKKYTLTAKNEIILSAGAFQSPQLLMVSGIGPKATLEKYSIPVVADRPGVGQNMWDHYDVEVTYAVNVETFNMLNNADYKAKAEAEWNSVPSVGILTSGGADYIAWEKLPNRTSLGTQGQQALAQFPADWPELEYEMAAVVRNASSNQNYGTAVVVNVTPLSRGNVTIVSNDSSVLPAISPNWLLDPIDQKVTVGGIRRMRELFQTHALAPVVVSEGIAPTEDIETDEQILNYAKSTGFMNWHAACTCKMGVSSDPLAVVDSKANVIGVSGLRVVDASSFALLPPGHPLSTIYVLAEKISAEIVAMYN